MGVFASRGDFVFTPAARHVLLYWDSPVWLAVVQRMLLRHGVASEIRTGNRGAFLRVAKGNLQTLIYKVLRNPITPKDMFRDLKKQVLNSEKFQDPIVSVARLGSEEVFACDAGMVANANGFVILL